MTEDEHDMAWHRAEMNMRRMKAEREELERQYRWVKWELLVIEGGIYVLALLIGVAVWLILT